MINHKQFATLAMGAALTLFATVASAQNYTAYDLGEGEASAINGNTVVGFTGTDAAATATVWTGTTASSGSKFGVTNNSWAFNISGSTVVGY